MAYESRPGAPIRDDLTARDARPPPDLLAVQLMTEPWLLNAGRSFCSQRSRPTPCLPPGPSELRRLVAAMGRPCLDDSAAYTSSSLAGGRGRRVLDPYSTCLNQDESFNFPAHYEAPLGSWSGQRPPISSRPMPNLDDLF